MNKEKLNENVKDFEQNQLLEDFKIEELEERFEMGWFRNGVKVEAQPAMFDAGETIESNTTAVGGRVNINF